MGGITSLNTAFSGLKAAQAGLYVTGHNMTNVQTEGYVRQRVIQNSFSSITVGVSSTSKMQVGLGTDVREINQIRNKFLDMSYRDKASQTGYYGVKYEAGSEIQSIIGELDGNYRLQAAFEHLWESLQDLYTKPQGLETRENFISSALIFIDRTKDSYESLLAYQNELDLHVRQSVSDVNDLVSEINQLNTLIQRTEFSGDNANDYRDQRNLALDRLSELMDITYDEMPDGRIDILVGSHELLTRGMQTTLGLRYTTPGYSFVEPVFTDSKEILSYDTDATALYTLTGTITSEQGNDKGALKGLLVTRGSQPATYATNPVKPDETDTVKYPNGKEDPLYKKDLLQYEKDLFNVNECMIPSAMKKLDALVNKVVTMINDAFAPYTYATDAITGEYIDKNGAAFYLDDDGNPLYVSNDKPVPSDRLVYVKDPNAPYDLNKTQSYTEIFIRKGMDRFDKDGNYNEEDPDDFYSLYTLRNLMLNPVFRAEDGGMNYIATSLSGTLEDQTVLKGLLDAWTDIGIDKLYNNFVTDIGTETQQAQTKAESLTEILVELDSRRSQISGVSLDEEMTNMMKYQYAYNAASRIVNYIDSMIDKIINGTGR